MTAIDVPTERMHAQSLGKGGSNVGICAVLEQGQGDFGVPPNARQVQTRFAIVTGPLYPRGVSFEIGSDVVRIVFFFRTELWVHEKESQ